jgi:hypothetical protein
MEMPFQWGQGGQKLTPSQAKAMRDVAAALAARKNTPQNLGEGLSSVGDALLYNSNMARAGEAESEGMSRVAQALAEARAGGDPTAFLNVMGNEWASPGQQMIAGELYKSSKPDWQTAQSEGDILRWNQNDPNSTPEVFYDGPNPDRKYEKDAAGNLRYIDTGEPVFTGAEAGEPLPDVTGESALRNEYNQLNTTKDFGLQTSAYKRVLDSARDPSPAGDLALIFNYMKVLDPGSTVREGEFATAQNSGSVPERIWAQYNNVKTGERLVPEIRQDFVKRAGDLFQGAAGLQEGTNARYSELATDYGYDPGRIVAEVPKIGVLDPEFNLADYLQQAPDGTVTQTKPLPVTSEADYQAIPAGAEYVDPEGNIRVKS